MLLLYSDGSVKAHYPCVLRVASLLLYLFSSYLPLLACCVSSLPLPHLEFSLSLYCFLAPLRPLQTRQGYSAGCAACIQQASNIILNIRHTAGIDMLEWYCTCRTEWQVPRASGGVAGTCGSSATDKHVSQRRTRGGIRVTIRAYGVSGEPSTTARH